MLAADIDDVGETHDVVLECKELDVMSGEESLEFDE
jgi:hypothetical protein